MWARIRNRRVKLQHLFMREEGQDLVEYAMIVGLIASAVFFSLSTVTAPLNNLISKGATMLANA